MEFCICLSRRCGLLLDFLNPFEIAMFDGQMLYTRKLAVRMVSLRLIWKTHAHPLSAFSPYLLHKSAYDTKTPCLMFLNSVSLVTFHKIKMLQKHTECKYRIYTVHAKMAS